MRFVGAERADIAFLEILTKLDQIHPLRVINKILKKKFSILSSRRVWI
jgi:hypothetical protein